MTVPRSPSCSTSCVRIACGMGLPVLAIAVAVPPATGGALVRRLRDVRQQRQLARTLDCRRDLALVPAASARDAARADLAAFADEPAQRAEVLVVDLVDLVLAVRARLAPTGARTALLVTPPRGAPTLLCHLALPR